MQNFGFYAWLVPSPKTCSQLALLGDFFPSPDIKYDHATDYHVTLAHSSTYPAMKVPELRKPITAKATKFSIFNASLVLELDSNSLQRLFYYLKDQGLTYDYPEYNPHITVGKVLNTNTSMLQELNLIEMGKFHIELLPLIFCSTLS